MVEKQTYPDLQWLSDPDPGAIGEKRNRLVKRASGEVIVHFDDDDWYSPRYVEEMVSRLGDLDLYKLSQYEARDIESGKVGVVDLLDRSGKHLAYPGLEEFDMGVYKNPDPWAFGCTYVYKRDRWCIEKFPSVDWNEDGEWARKIPNGKKGHGPSDGLFVKGCHKRCSSTTYVRGGSPPC